MGSSCISLSLLLLMAIIVSELLVSGDSKTYWGDVKVSKVLKKGLDPSSITPRSCVSSWDFKMDPCDYIFSEHFTSGFRCDMFVSGLSRVTEITLLGDTQSLRQFLHRLNSKLIHLRRLALSMNSFSGTIPDSVGSLSKPKELYLYRNFLTGHIPMSFKGLVILQRLELQGNNLTSEFPDLGTLKNLSFIDCSNNAITWEFPAILPASIIEDSMRNNSFQGALPRGLRELMFLQIMDVSKNQLSGSLPSILFNHPSLQQLTLSHNNLTSLGRAISMNMGSKSELIALDLSNNQLQGLLPAFMAMIPKLSALSVENNKFTEMIPTQYALKAVGGTFKFARLLLGGNYLFGPIPRPFWGLHLVLL